MRMKRGKKNNKKTDAHQSLSTYIHTPLFSVNAVNGNLERIKIKHL